jgi:hypothetical protein
MRHECKCGNTIAPERYQLGFRVCLECGDWIARQRRHTIIPMHKSNYTVVTNRDELKQINPKRIGE